jgi:transcription termination factor Rho
MSDLQLERSVLEAKERDELFAIAAALGESPPARTKKADLVSQILQVTGVESAPAPAEKARRARTRRTKDEAAVETPQQLALPEDGAPAPSTALATGAAPAPSTNGHRAGLGPAVAPRGARARAASSLEDGGAGPRPDADAGDGAGAATVAGGSAGVAVPAPTDGEPSGEAPPSELVAREAREPREAREAREARDAPPGDGLQPFQRGDYGRGRTDGDVGLGNNRRRRRRNRDKPSRAPEREMVAAPEVPYSGELVTCSGLLDLREEGYGFLRTNGYLASSSDVYVSITQVRRFGLRKGDFVEGAYRPAASNEKYPALVRVDSVSGLQPDDARNRP